MKSLRVPIALLVLLAGITPARAQVPIYPGLYGGPGVSVGGKVKAGRLRVGFSAYLPGAYGPGFYPPYYPPGFVNRTTVVQVYAPPPPPPVVVAPALPRFNFVNEPLIAPGQHVPLIEAPPGDQRPLPGQPAGVFRPILPEDRARALQPLPPAPPPEPPPPPEQPKPPAKPAAQPPKAKPPERLPLPPQPEADPRAEARRQNDLGKDAFANQEYGRAAHRFRLAVAAAPDEPAAYFLLAQALLALDKYPEAVEAVHAGMRRQAGWPLARFRPLELYEPNVAAYPEHLRQLEEILDRHPNDPALLFLYAYQLWFDGRKDEARALFQRAAPLAPDRTFIDRFLQAAVAPQVV